MDKNKLIAYLLIGIGALFLLGRIGDDAGWLWVGLVSAAFLYAYTNQKRYGLLVTGSILAGVAVGLVISTWAGLMISLAVGFLMIDRVEPRGNRWPTTVAAILAGVGILGWLLDSGIFGSFWFALVLIGGGAYLLSKGREHKPEVASTTGDTFVTPGPQPTEAAPRVDAGIETSAEPINVGGPSSVTAAPLNVAPAPTMTSSQPDTTVSKADIIPADGVTDVATVELDENLVERLETWRRETSRTEDRAAYLILTNETLREVATQKPQTLDELRSVKGIGPVKQERYGEAILDIVRSA